MIIDIKNGTTTFNFEDKNTNNMEKIKKILSENDINFNDNLLLNCDNLLGLEVLKCKLKEKIDVIYIDPPYYFHKTKNKNSFKYNSNFDLKEWLDFLYQRLTKAKELLTNDGVIFISTNDDGVYHLKLLCDQIFGLQNHLTTIKWNKNNTQNDVLFFQENVEYILTYKKRDYVELKTLELEKSKPIKKDNKYFLKKGHILKGGEDGFLNNSPTLGYSIYFNPITNEVIPKMDYNKEIAKYSNIYKEIYEIPDTNLINKGFELIRPPLSKGRIKRWTWGFDKMVKDNKSLLFSKKKDGNYSIYSLKEIDKNLIKNGYYEEYIKKPPKNFITITNANGSGRINNLFNGKENFAYAKPVELMNYLFKLFLGKKDIKVLDFFAGSGTVGESIMLLNKEDQQKRTFYLIEQLDYAKSLTYERLVKVKDLENLKENFQFFKI